MLPCLVRQEGLPSGRWVSLFGSSILGLLFFQVSVNQQGVQVENSELLVPTPVSRYRPSQIVLSCAPGSKVK